MSREVPKMKDVEYKLNKRNFTGSLVVKTQHSQCRGPGFNPWSESQITHSAAKIPNVRAKTGAVK